MTAPPKPAAAREAAGAPAKGAKITMKSAGVVNTIRTQNPALGTDLKFSWMAGKVELRLAPDMTTSELSNSRVIWVISEGFDLGWVIDDLSLLLLRSISSQE
jgi:hypothetical protein